MKVFTFAALLLFLALPAHAQHVGSASTQVNQGGGGGGGGGQMGGDYGSSNHIAVTEFHVVAAHGSSDFVDSTYMAYDRALEIGEAILARQQKTLGQIAREYRADKAAKKLSRVETQQ